MKNKIINRLISGIVFSLVLCVFQITVQKITILNLQKEEIELKKYYNEVNMTEFLDASIIGEVINSNVVQVTFSRTAPFDIAGTQIQEMKAFCGGVPYIMRKREPIHISMDAGRRDVVISYNLDQWGKENVPRTLRGCDINITRSYELILPYNIKRIFEMKTTFEYK